MKRIKLRKKDEKELLNKRICIRGGLFFTRTFIFKKSNYLYRNTDPEWLLEFLEDGEAQPPFEGEFIALSFKEDSGGGHFKGVRIAFDEAKIYEQDGYPIDYDLINVEEVAHLSGLTEEERESLGEREFEIIMGDIDVDAYRHEEEVVIERLEYETGLIKKVWISKKAVDDLKNQLLDKDIPFEIIL